MRANLGSNISPPLNSGNTLPAPRPVSVKTRPLISAGAAVGNVLDCVIVKVNPATSGSQKTLGGFSKTVPAELGKSRDGKKEQKIKE